MTVDKSRECKLRGRHHGIQMIHGPCNTGTHLPTFRTLSRGTIQNQVISEKTVSYFRYLQGCYLEGEAGNSMGFQKEKQPGGGRWKEVEAGRTSNELEREAAVD